MSYATLMVNLELGRSNAGLLRVANTIAKRFKAQVVAIAARQPSQLIYTDGCYIPPEVIEDEREEGDKEMRAAEAEFRGLIEVPDIHWRSTVSFEMLSAYVAREARCADLLLTGMPAHKRGDDMGVTAGELIMQSGRPVLVVPEAPASLSLDHVVLGWKDTRETRRATLDALPLIKNAGQVTVMEIAVQEDLVDARERLADVAGWLTRHGVSAETMASPSTGDDVQQLRTLALGKGADLIVAGAYGHSRLHEWALGGVTKDLLLRSECCTLLSH